VDESMRDDNARTLKLSLPTKMQWEMTIEGKSTSYMVYSTARGIDALMQVLLNTNEVTLLVVFQKGDDGSVFANKLIG
jgi:hypothetical protein